MSARLTIAQCALLTACATTSDPVPFPDAFPETIAILDCVDTPTGMICSARSPDEPSGWIQV